MVQIEICLELCCLLYFIFSFHLGHVPQRLVGPGPWVNPIQYFYCSCCAPVGGGMVQPPAVVDGGSQVTNGLFAFSDTVSLKSRLTQFFKMLNIVFEHSRSI